MVFVATFFWSMFIWKWETIFAFSWGMYSDLNVCFILYFWAHFLPQNCAASRSLLCSFLRFKKKRQIWKKRKQVLAHTKKMITKKLITSYFLSLRNKKKDNLIWKKRKRVSTRTKKTDNVSFFQSFFEFKKRKKRHIWRKRKQVSTRTNKIDNKFFFELKKQNKKNKLKQKGNEF